MVRSPPPRRSLIPLLIIDEIGCIPFDSEAGNLVFSLVSKRYERASVIVTTFLGGCSFWVVRPAAAWQAEPDPTGQIAPLRRPAESSSIACADGLCADATIGRAPGRSPHHVRLRPFSRSTIEEEISDEHQAAFDSPRQLPHP
jgi:hypothetical protein